MAETKYGIAQEDMEDMDMDQAEEDRQRETSPPKHASFPDDKTKPKESEQD